MEVWRRRSLSDRALSDLLREPVSTVGQWCYFASLADRFGLVPLEAMPDTAAAADCLPFTLRLQDTLRRGAWELRTGQTDRESILRRAASVLRESLGEPPGHFSYQGEDCTPPELLRKSGIRLEDYVTLIHHPIRPWPCAYHEDRQASDPFLTLLSVDMETIRKLALRQLKDGMQVVIGADVRRERDRTAGELSLSGSSRLPKAEAIAYRQIRACHVMSIDGWSEDGRWKVQDSHGTDTGPDGHYVMTDSWFDAYVLSAVVRKEYLSPELLALLETPVYMPKEERF